MRLLIAILLLSLSGYGQTTYCPINIGSKGSSSGSGNVWFLAVGGGGAGSKGGGGGGGVRDTNGYNYPVTHAHGAYTIVIANGGTAVGVGTVGGNGGNSSFDGLIAYGGGGGGSSASNNGANGG